MLMYSFKGGAGRTVTTGNIAYILAREMHRRVLCIDLDVESAGSSVLFDLQDEVLAGRCWTVQDVLRGYVEAPDASGRKESIALNRADFETRIWPNMRRRLCESPKGGYLDVIPGRTILTTADERKSASDGGQQQFERLLQKIDGMRDRPEIILYDSASGLQDTAMMGLANCHTLVMFVRWSRQFIYGTTRFLRHYILSKKFCPRIAKVFVVPTAVPAVDPQGRLREELDERRDELRKTIYVVNQDAQPFGAGKDWVELLSPVYECSALKWDDRIFLKEGGTDQDGEIETVLRDYRQLAARLTENI